MWQAAEKFRFEGNAASSRSAGSKGKCSRWQDILNFRKCSKPMDKGKEKKLVQTDIQVRSQSGMQAKRCSIFFHRI